MREDGGEPRLPNRRPAGVPTVLADLVYPARGLLRGKVPKHVLYCFGTGLSEPLEDEHEQGSSDHCDP